MSKQKVVKSGKYKLIYRPHHKFADSQGHVLEHRYNKELDLGRYLDPKEVVHHNNANPHDNLEDNLTLFQTHSEHVKFEMIEYRENIISKRRCSHPECPHPERTKNRITIDSKHVSGDWYGNDEDGWICHSCYERERYRAKKSLKHLI